MSSLEIVHPSSVPPLQAVTPGETGAAQVVVVDFDAVTRAREFAHQVRSDSTSRDDMDLATAVLSLADAITDIVRGLHHGRVAVHNYPITGAHLDE